MTLSRSNPRAKKRWGIAAAVVATLTLSVGGQVFAAGPLPGSNFEGDDGNLVVNTTSNTDWANVAGLNTGIDKPSGKTDNSFGQGTKEDISAVTVVTGSIPPNKNDLTRFYEASEHKNGADYLYLAWERAVNIGNANLDFEISQNKTTSFTTTATGDITLNRTAGDMLVSYDFGGSGTPTLGLNRWVTGAHTPDLSSIGFATNTCFSANTFPCWGDHKTLGSSEAEGAVNTVGINEVISGVNPLGIGLFGEAAINLTTSGVFPAGTCESFGTVFVKSRSSSSFTAELKDFIAPIDVNISNCATVITRKVTDPAGNSQSFGFTTNVTTSPSTTTSPFSLTGVTTNDANVNTIENVLPGSYNTTEGTVTGWTLTGVNCDASAMAGTAPSTSVANRQATYTVAAGDVVDCTFTNTKDKANPAASSSPSVIPQDKVTVSNAFDNTGSASGAADQTMTVSLYAAADTTCGSTPVYTETFTVNASGDYVTSNTGDPADNSGYTITSSGTYRWKAVYNGDTRNNGFTVGCGVESINVTLTGTP